VAVVISLNNFLGPVDDTVTSKNAALSTKHLPTVIVARWCLCLSTEIANLPCSWCAGNMSPPLLPPGDRRHLLPGHLPHGRTVAGAVVPHCAGTGMGDGCWRASLCAHGRLMLVTRLRVLRQMPHPVPAVCAVLMRGAAVRSPRSLRELVGRAGGIAAARSVVCRVLVFWGP
jgi:hypothetical protein